MCDKPSPIALEIPREIPIMEVFAKNLPQPV
jgi:hypothetical protein